MAYYNGIAKVLDYQSGYANSAYYKTVEVNWRGVIMPTFFYDLKLDLYIPISHIFNRYGKF